MFLEEIDSCSKIMYNDAAAMYQSHCKKCAQNEEFKKTTIVEKRTFA